MSVLVFSDCVFSVFSPIMLNLRALRGQRVRGRRKGGTRWTRVFVLGLDFDGERRAVLAENEVVGGPSLM